MCVILRSVPSRDVIDSSDSDLTSSKNGFQPSLLRLTNSTGDIDFRYSPSFPIPETRVLPGSELNDRTLVIIVRESIVRSLPLITYPIPSMTLIASVA